MHGGSIYQYVDYYLDRQAGYDPCRYIKQSGAFSNINAELMDLSSDAPCLESHEEIGRVSQPPSRDDNPRQISLHNPLHAVPEGLALDVIADAGMDLLPFFTLWC